MPVYVEISHLMLDFMHLSIFILAHWFKGVSKVAAFVA